MTKPRVDLSKYNNSWYQPGAALKCLLWYFVNVLVIRNTLLPFSGWRVLCLKLFGAHVGKKVVIKPGVNIKYPWKLTIGAYSWIGENVWIDNLDEVKIGAHVCVSQGALILSGNHNYKSPTFNLMIAPITIEDGAWIGAKTVICKGVNIGTHAMLTVGSVASTNMEAYGIYKGNPAVQVKKRVIVP